ncbi:flagellar basal body rod protein FlgB [Paenibacillus sp. 1001270B_150601_E10]|uniref:flagellar basal body rod protein FlgB n=1 Tax=Paenibacillus sp. 1001270B_150601_E10 TaxID=2787079 RepID=UPI0018A10788|nr:flagellar basal body rod protein FlgB [Paenibacillus sp. 1001270B_150601_E10]
MNLLGGVHVKQLEGALQAASTRQNVISNNLANVDTPHYKRSEVQFESLLREQLTGGTLAGKRTNEKHIPIGPNQSAVPEWKTVTDQSTVMGNNGNNVNVDVEMANQAENQLRYYTYIGQINHHINMMRTAIDVRR